MVTVERTYCAIDTYGWTQVNHICQCTITREFVLKFIKNRYKFLLLHIIINIIFY